MLLQLQLQLRVIVHNPFPLYSASCSLAVLTKSATLLPQTGNPHPRTWHAPSGIASFNSEGLPNNGIDYYMDGVTIDECFAGSTDDSDRKPYIVSLSGKTLVDNLEMLERIGKAPTRTRIASIELNLACPNVIGKPIIAYDTDQMKDILKKVSGVYQKHSKSKTPLPPLGVKLPPFLDFSHFQAAAAVLNQHADGSVKYVVCINTVGNALAIDARSNAPHMSSNDGYAGMSGPAVKYVALANVRKFRQLLDPAIDVVGAGGIATGRDAYEMLLAGAAACQVATCHWKEGPSCFDRIVDELADLLTKRGYAKVSDVQGALQPWTPEGAALSRAKSKEEAKDGAASSLSTNFGASTAGTSGDTNFYKALSAVLAIVLAAVCAHTWTNARILPSECLL
jgi:dihydroorotate dehydrogenase (fumarate)